MRIRTGFSFRTAVGHLEEVISRLTEICWKVAPISDRVSTFGYTRYTKLAKKAGMRPVYGVEIGVVEALGEKKPTIDYWTFYAKDNLRSLHELIALATNNPGKEPTLLYSQALAAKGLIKISGERLLIKEDLADDKDFYVGLSPSLPKGLFVAAKDAGLRFIATGDNYFTRKEDLEFYRIGLGWRSGTQTYPQWILSDKEWKDAVKWTADSKTAQAAIRTRDRCFEQCRAELKKATLLKPKVSKTLRQMCIEGAKEKGVNLKDAVYKERLERELALIDEKKFEDYFFIISDLIQWARKRMAVGPARGSSCGSLVCYLLDITTIDPIPYGLIFERFIDINRSDLPDIDVDFSDARRSMVFDYAVKKYGADHVAKLGTVGLFKPRSALKAAGAALKIPVWRIEKVLDGLIERSSGDSRAMLQLADTLDETENGRKFKEEFPSALIAARLEGHPNNSSQHAAGIVATQDPVSEYVAIDSRTKTVMCDKKDSEELNLLKIDALGLTQLSIFERALDLIGKGGQYRLLETLPLNDQKAFDVLNNGHFAGVFQFTGNALKSLTKQIDVNSLEDMVSITALARPGPMATGGAGAWVRRRNGHEKVTSLHPMLTELTKETLGITIYQEQVMRIVREMGNMSWEDTSAIRKAMSGRLGNEFFERYYLKFKAGALANGIDEGTAKDIWDQINTFGSWAFNRSHAVAYGIVSYQCCWLKAYHPVEFAAATLDAESDPAKQISLLRELRSEGIDYKPVDPEHSIDRWTIAKKGKKTTLIGPLTSIKGIGPSTVKEIMDARAHGVPIRDTLVKRLEKAKTEIDTLFPIEDAVKKMYPNGLEEAGIVTPPTAIIDAQCGVKGDVLIIGVVKKVAPKDENEAVNVMKRGGKVLKGPTSALNLFFVDDTDEIFCKINRFDFERIGRHVAENARVGKSIYAVKGRVPAGFRMISIDRIKHLGDIDGIDFKGDTGARAGIKLKAGDQSADS